MERGSRTDWGSLKWALNRPMDFLFIQQFSNSPFISRLSHDENKEHAEYYQELMNKGIEKGALKDIPSDLMYQLSSYQIYGVIHYLLRQPEIQKKSDYISMAFEFYWDSISI
jgi:hypothetical protein